MKNLLDTSKNQIWYLPRSLVIEELYERQYLLFSVAVIAAALFLLIIWSAFLTIYETAVTYGELEPVGEVHIVQHLEGGIIKRTFVKDGEEVKAGQPLLKLDETLFYSQLQELQARKLSLESDVARLRAFTDGVNLTQFLLGSEDSILKQIVVDDLKMLNLQNSALNDQRAVILSQIKQKEDELKKLKQQQPMMQDSVKLIKSELQMYEELLPKGYVSKREYLRLQRDYNLSINQLTQINGDIEKAESSLLEGKNKLAELNSKTQYDAIRQLADANSELAEVTYRINKLNDQVARTTVTAPIAGTIKGFNLTQGAVVRPGEPILNIVPADQELQVVTKISTRDIGYIKAGDPVKIKILTYDFARYGYIEGRLTDISASTFYENNKNNEQPYYKAKIRLAQQYVKDPKYRLRPGMTVQADIITGDKTLLQYLLKPIHLTSDAAFRER